MPLVEQWKAEKESAWLYRSVANAETEHAIRRLFEQLAQTAERQAGLIETRMSETGIPVPGSFAPSRRARLVSSLAHLLGPRRIRPILAAMKVRGVSIYLSAPEGAEHLVPRSVEDFGHRHRRSGAGNSLRAAVFGINDGLVSNTSLIMGVTGAAADPELILVTGIAGLLAGAFSMAAGEYLSVRSQRELYEYQISLEREELKLYPEAEAEELALIYGARGVPLERAREMAGLVFRDPERALKTMAIEELGLNPDDLASPAAAASASFLAFGLGALVPLLPFFFSPRAVAIPAAASLAAAALFGVGAVLSLFTGRVAWRGGLRMLALGGAAALATYLIGRLLGVALS